MSQIRFAELLPRDLTEREYEKISNDWIRFLRLSEDLEFVKKNEPSAYILSFGAGRQTVAMLFELTPLFRRNKNAWVVFADTGGEHQETYDYLNDYVIPYCKTHEIQFVRVYNKYGKDLYQYCFDKRIVPSMKYRDCTSKFKIAPIRKFISKELKITRTHPCYIFLGISDDEADRMNVSSVKYAKNVFPFIDGFRDLINSGIRLLDCLEIVKNLGFPPVPKSGCWFCPYAQTSDIIDPRYKSKTIALEENNSRYPEIKLRGMGKNTKSIRDLTEADISLETCKSGYCHV